MPRLTLPKDPRGRPICPSSSCAWNDHGEDCQQPGIHSFSTNGTAPWYCRRHWYELQGYPDMQAEGLQGNQLPKTPLHSYAVDAMHKAISSKRKPGED